MSDGEPNLARFTALSDGIFAVIITIMVLDLRPPARHDVRALLELWPEATSYTVSYLFIAVVWLNHHHVVGYATKLTSVLALSNFANLFAISLIPFTTAWLASSRVAAFPLTVYATVFLLVELTYIVLMRETFKQGFSTQPQKQTQRMYFVRAWIMAAIFAFAAFAVFVPVGIRLALTTSFLLLHIRPNMLRTHSHRNRSGSSE
jgi:uncharacterized membrane protein